MATVCRPLKAGVKCAVADIRNAQVARACTAHAITAADMDRPHVPQTQVQRRG